MKELFEPSPEQVVPRIKMPAYVEAIRETTGQEPVFDQFIGELVIAYAFDSPLAFRMMMESDLEGLGVERGELLGLAVDNLLSGEFEIALRGGPPIAGLDVGGDREACMLLVGSIWDDLSEQLPPEIVVAAPHRDIVLVSSNAIPEGVERMAEMVEEIFEKDESPHLLTRDLFAWRAGGWEVFDLSELYEDEEDDDEDGFDDDE